MSSTSIPSRAGPRPKGHGSDPPGLERPVRAGVPARAAARAGCIGKIRVMGFINPPWKAREDNPIDFLVHVRKVGKPLYPQFGLEPNVDNLLATAPPILIVEGSVVGANTIIGLDTRYAMRRVINVNAAYSAIEQFVIDEAVDAARDAKATAVADIVATLKRSDFGMTKYIPSVGDEVRLLIAVDVVRGQVRPEHALEFVEGSHSLENFYCSVLLHRKNSL